MANGPLIGLTGGIGSGKSTVTAILVGLGAHVLDADKIGHEVYLPGTEGFRRVVEAFGGEIVASDGTIDRQSLGARVFADPAALRRLNALVHPLIGDEIRRRVAAAYGAADGWPIVVEAAIMLEAGWRFFDQIWVVVVG
ncbi:MAG: dephospho-CoA kinase, partial [Candidatus Binatia bacterium]